MGFDGLEFGEGLLLSGIKGDLFAIGGRRRGIWSSGGDGGWNCGLNRCSVNSVGGRGSGRGRDSGRGRGSGGFFAAIFLNAEGKKKIGGFGDWI